jgi:two-component system, cell cycle sensor histidine kinase and response regulator CckA
VKGRYTLPILILVFVVLAAGIVAAGCLFYRSQQDRYQTEVEHRLSAVADLKTSELSRWRNERLADASVFYKNSAFSTLVRRCIERPQDLPLQEELRTWIGHFQVSEQYDRIVLLDATGNKWMSVPDTKESLSSDTIQKAREALRSGQLTFEDFLRNEYTKKIYLRQFVPILDGQAGGRPLGVLMLRIDPSIYLYPFIQRWPTPSKTGETLLIHREGNEAVFLNELRFQKNTALTLRVSLDSTELPAAQAALGREGIVEGVDYRGVPVLAAVRAVPDSPWFLVAKIDAAEVFAPMREWLWLTILFVGTLLFGTAAAVGLIWRDQSARFDRERAKAAETLREVNENLDITLKSIGDAVISTDTAGRINRMNPVAETLTGWTLAEATGRPLPEVFRIINAQTRQPVVNPVAKVLETGYIVGLANHTALIARDGTERQIADSASPIRNAAGQTQGVVLIFRDVTHEYAAAERLRLLDRAINAAGEGICITGPNEASNPLVYVNHGFEQLTGYPAKEVLGQNMRFLQGADTDQAAVDRLWAATESEQEFSVELLNYRKDGTPFWNQISITPVRDAAEKVSHLVAVLHDLTDRKRAEETLRDSEIQYRRLFEAAKDGILILDAETGMILDVNPFLVEMLGYSHKQLLGKKIWDLGLFKDIVASEANFVALQQQEYIRYEDQPLETTDGQRRDVEFISNVYQVEHRKIIQCNIRDITERKRAQEALQELLREKESLLKEVHHRVKNNLQVISSLMRLQSSQVDNPVAQAALRDMQNRIGSMALLHETLYQSDSFARVNLATYLQSLCSQLFHSLVANPESIQLCLDVASVSLDVNQAVPCGLLVNELVSNCLKHAFPNGRQGEIRVEVQPVDDGPAVRLRVADNGVGLPADFDMQQLHSLGLQLVSDLVSQIQGRLEIGGGPGAAFDVVFTPQTTHPAGGAL